MPSEKVKKETAPKKRLTTKLKSKLNGKSDRGQDFVDEFCKVPNAKLPKAG